MTLVPTLVPNRDKVNKDQEAADDDLEMLGDIPGDGGYEKDEAQGSPGDVVDSDLDLGEFSVMKSTFLLVSVALPDKFLFHADFPSLTNKPKTKTKKKKKSTKPKKNITMPKANPDLSPPRKKRKISGQAASYSIAKSPSRKENDSDLSSEGMLIT